MKIKNFIEQRNKRPFKLCSLAGFVCLTFITPFMSTWFINKKYSPNSITMMMLITGLVFGIIMLIPNIMLKLLCFGGFLFWFSFDCSDGEVARFTKVFSKYGKQLDWMAHLVCHPLFVIGMWKTICDFYPNFNNVSFTVFSMLFLAVEINHRNIVAITNMNDESFDLYPTTQVCSWYKAFLIYVKTQIAYFPNLVVFCPLFVFVDYVFELYVFPYIYIAWGIIYFIYAIKEFVASLKIMYKT